MVKVTEGKQGGWRVEIRVRLPDRTWHRERVKAPVASKSGAQRWGEARERHLLQHGPKKKEAPQAAAPVTTLRDFWPRFIADGVANRQKASTTHTKETIGRLYLLPALGNLPLDCIDNEQIARIKASLAKRSPEDDEQHSYRAVQAPAGRHRLADHPRHAVQDWLTQGAPAGDALP